MEVQNETMKIQRFENTFFKQLEFLAICRGDIKSANPPAIGRNAIKVIYEIFIEHYLNDLKQEDFLIDRVFKKECGAIFGIQSEYKNFYSEDFGAELGQYFRTIYNILKLIDGNELSINKKMYTNLLRAQLSRYELSLLFYNCLSTFGEEKMMPLVKKYKLLKHLEVSTLPSENIAIWQQFKIQQATV